MSQLQAPFAFVEAGPDAACRAALDRADRLRDDPAALQALWADAHVVLLDEKGHAYADDDGRLLAPSGTRIKVFA